MCTERKRGQNGPHKGEEVGETEGRPQGGSGGWVGFHPCLWTPRRSTKGHTRARREYEEQVGRVSPEHPLQSHGHVPRDRGGTSRSRVSVSPGSRTGEVGLLDTGVGDGPRG